MIACLGLLALISVAQGSVRPPEPARAVVAAAVRAVEGDSARRVRSRLSSRLSARPADRAALLGLATLDRLQYDYANAEQRYGQLTASGSDGYAVYAHLGLAEGYDGRGLGRPVRPELDAARELAHALGDRVAEAEALVWLAFVRGRLEGVRVAEALLDTAAWLVPDTALAVRARLHGRNAIVHALRGRAAAASAAADSGIRLARRAALNTLEADAHRMHGQVLQYRGQWDSALVALRRSEELYVRARNRSALASSLIWHAQVLGSQGRYGEMRDVMQRALAEGIATHNPNAVSDAYRAFGVLGAMFGDWTAAAAHFDRAAALSAEIGDSSAFMTTRKYQAKVALVAGDIEKARRLTLERLAWSYRTQDANARYEAQRTLADIAERTGDTVTVQRALADARAQLARLPGASYRVWLLHDEARHALARGDLLAATRSFESFLAGDAGAIGNLLQFDARVRLADVRARRGDVAGAERELIRATDELEQWRAGLDDAQLRSLAFQVVATVDAAAADPDAIAASAARALAALVDAGRIEQAYTLAERWRARELMDRLVRAAVLRTGQVAGAAGAVSAVEPKAAREVMAALPDAHTALLQFVAAGEAPVTAFVVQRSRIDARVLAPLDSMTSMVARLNTLVEAGGTPTPISRRLGAALLDSVLPLLDAGVARIIIVPDGLLHRVPFDALRLADGRFLLERYTSSIAPSASFAVAVRTPLPARHGSPPALLALADPVRAVTQSAANRSAVPAPVAELPADLPRLRGAAREVRAIARYAPAADVRTGRNASAAFLKNTDLRRYDVLHFATHAVVNENSLAGTALALAPGAGESGWIAAGDLAALRLEARLVVLSACNTAGGMLARGEGVQGLTSALLQAGARSLVATAWRIPDDDVQPLVEDFYAALARGLPVADALRAAKLSALRAGAPLRTWAAFVAIGDPSTVVPLRPPARWWSQLLRR